MVVSVPYQLAGASRAVAAEETTDGLRRPAEAGPRSGPSVREEVGPGGAPEADRSITSTDMPASVPDEARHPVHR